MKGQKIISCPAVEPFADPATPKVAVVGSVGYVGSALQQFLREDGYANVRGFDRNPRAMKFEQVVLCPVSAMENRRLRQFDVVLYIGGRIGRKES